MSVFSTQPLFDFQSVVFTLSYHRRRKHKLVKVTAVSSVVSRSPYTVNPTLVVDVGVTENISLLSSSHTDDLLMFPVFPRWYFLIVSEHFVFSLLRVWKQQMLHTPVKRNCPTMRMHLKHGLPVINPHRTVFKVFHVYFWSVCKTCVHW